MNIQILYAKIYANIRIFYSSLFHQKLVFPIHICSILVNGSFHYTFDQMKKLVILLFIMLYILFIGKL